MPLTAVTTLIGSLVMLGSWAFIGRRIHASPGGGTYQARLLHGFFLYLGIFFLFMFFPHVLLDSHPEQFPLAMALGYVVGHIFMYLGLINIIRLTFSIVPRLNHKDNLAVAFGIVATIAITVLNAITMIGGTRPEYSAEHGVTLFNTAPAVGAAIAIFSAITVLPTATLMIVNGVTNPSARTRSFLLGGGLFILMTAGPLHDTARTAGLYMFADIVSMASLILIASGVVYRIEERISLARPARAQS